MAGGSFVEKKDSRQEALEYWNKDMRVKLEDDHACYINDL